MRAKLFRKGWGIIVFLFHPKNLERLKEKHPNMEIIE